MVGARVGDGASPRARGKRSAQPPHLRRRGCIPACAGETIRLKSCRVLIGVHPRVRAGNRVKILAVTVTSATSLHTGEPPEWLGLSELKPVTRVPEATPGPHSAPESAPYATRTRYPSPAPRLWTPPLPWTQRARPPELAKPRRRGFAQRPQLHCCCWYFNLNELNDGPEDRQVSRFAQFYVTADRARRRSGHGRRARGRSAARSSNRGRYGRSENRKAKTAPTIQKGRSGRNRSQDHPEDTERGNGEPRAA